MKRGPKPEIVFTKATKERMLAKCYEKFDIKDEMDFLFKTSVIIRKEIDSMKDWQFTVTFSDFETPRKLNQLMTGIISGAYNNLNEKRDTAIEKSSRNLAQHIISSYRTRRQLIYQSKADSKFQKQKRTPLSVEVSLTSYHSNRSKSDIQTLNSIDLATPDDDVQ